MSAEQINALDAPGVAAKKESNLSKLRQLVRDAQDLAPKMRPDGSVFVVIRPHLLKGVLSDYVLRTRLALRETG